MTATANLIRKAAYPTKAKIKAAIEVARELGLDVVGFTVSPDGSIQVIESRAVPVRASGQASDFDRWESEL